MKFIVFQSNDTCSLHQRFKYLQSSFHWSVALRCCQHLWGPQAGPGGTSAPQGEERCVQELGGQGSPACVDSHPLLLSWWLCVYMGFVPLYLCPLILVCFSGLWPHSWPKFQVLSFSFVFLVSLSRPPQLAINTTQTQNERNGKGGNFTGSVEWLKRKKVVFILFFFFLNQVTCLTCIDQPSDLHPFISSNGQPNGIR